jgi:hypothetical protein
MYSFFCFAQKKKFSTPQQRKIYTATAKFLHRSNKKSTPQQQNFLTAQ